VALGLHGERGTRGGAAPEWPTAAANLGRGAEAAQARATQRPMNADGVLEKLRKRVDTQSHVLESVEIVGLVIVIQRRQILLLRHLDGKWAQPEPDEHHVHQCAPAATVAILERVDADHIGVQLKSRSQCRGFVVGCVGIALQMAKSLTEPVEYVCEFARDITPVRGPMRTEDEVLAAKVVTSTTPAMGAHASEEVEVQGFEKPHSYLHARKGSPMHPCKQGMEVLRQPFFLIERVTTVGISSRGDYPSW